MEIRPVLSEETDEKTEEELVLEMNALVDNYDKNHRDGGL